MLSGVAARKRSRIENENEASDSARSSESAMGRSPQNHHQYQCISIPDTIDYLRKLSLPETKPQSWLGPLLGPLSALLDGAECGIDRFYGFRSARLGLLLRSFPTPVASLVIEYDFCEVFHQRKPRGRLADAVPVIEEQKQLIGPMLAVVRQPSDPTLEVTKPCASAELSINMDFSIGRGRFVLHVRQDLDEYQLGEGVELWLSDHRRGGAKNVPIGRYVPHRTENDNLHQCPPFAVFGGHPDHLIVADEDAGCIIDSSGERVVFRPLPWEHSTLHAHPDGDARLLPRFLPECQTHLPASPPTPVSPRKGLLAFHYENKKLDPMSPLVSITMVYSSDWDDAPGGAEGERSPLRLDRQYTGLSGGVSTYWDMHVDFSPVDARHSFTRTLRLFK